MTFIETPLIILIGTVKDLKIGVSNPQKNVCNPQKNVSKSLE